MKRIVFSLMALFCAGTLSAKLMSAKWGTEPAAPVYAGQVYDLTLTLETLPEEEISGVRMEQGPGRPPERQSTYQKEGRRYTVLHWQQCEAKEKIVSIPAGRLQANVTQVQNFGHFRSASTTTQIVTVPAFDYEVQALPGEARGLPIGNLELNLGADRRFFAPGEVRLLTATLKAHEGYVPQAYVFTLEDTDSGELYPFRVITQSEHEVSAQAHFVVTAERDVTLRLKSLKAFELVGRSVKEVVCPPLTLRMRLPEETQEEDTAITVSQDAKANRGHPLRFAPVDGAPIVGTLASPWQVEETRETWSRVRTPTGAGWIRTTLLKEERP